MKKVFMFLMILVFGLCLPVFTFAEVTEENPLPPDPLMLGMIEGTGTHFEVTDSEYLNIVLDSSETITLRLESVPEMVTMNIEAASEVTSTQIAISGFEPSTTYYKYEDDYHNEETFATDENGSYSWTQDLSQQHFVFVQPRKGTKFIKDDATGGDCISIGTWDSAVKTCTLTTDVYETIQLDSNYITLDGNWHTVRGMVSGSGVYLPGRIGVTIKNLKVENFSNGISLVNSSNNTITGNTTSNNWGDGILLQFSINNTLNDNISQENRHYDLLVLAYLDSHCNNVIQNTTGSGGRPIKYFNSSVNLENEVLSQLILCNADYSNINSVIIEGSETFKNNGLAVTRTDYSNITNTTSSNRAYGIRLGNSSNNTLTGNTTSNNECGISLWFSSNNILTNNIALNNSSAIEIVASNNNTLTDNTTSNNGSGTFFYHSINSTLTNNTVCNNNHYDFYCMGSSFFTESGNRCDKLDGCSINCTPCAADTTPPSTTATLSGTSGNNGWYLSNVTISLSATDSDSGVKEIHYSVDGIETVVSGSLASLTISTEGMHTLNYYAIDNANNNETAHTLAINIDKTPPAIIASVNPVAGANGWNTTDVTVSFTCSDSTSGIATCPSPVTVTTDGAGQVITGTAIDNAGNTSTTSVTLNIDKTPPVITISGVSNGATYALGIVPEASYTVTDATSGIATSNASLTGGNSYGMGTFTYSVTATDNAGNVATQNVTYTVIASIEGLIELVRQFLNSGDIDNAGIANSLISKLENALSAKNSGNEQASDNIMQAFINQLEAQSGKHISTYAAAILINAATYVINN